MQEQKKEQKSEGNFWLTVANFIVDKRRQFCCFFFLQRFIVRMDLL